MQADGSTGGGMQQHNDFKVRIQARLISLEGTAVVEGGAVWCCMVLSARAAREVEGCGTSWKPLVVQYPLTLAAANH